MNNASRKEDHQGHKALTWTPQYDRTRSPKGTKRCTMKPDFDNHVGNRGHSGRRYSNPVVGVHATGCWWWGGTCCHPIVVRKGKRLLRSVPAMATPHCCSIARPWAPQSPKSPCEQIPKKTIVIRKGIHVRMTRKKYAVRRSNHSPFDSTAATEGVPVLVL